MIQTVLSFGALAVTMFIGNALYYLVGTFKKVSSTSLEEMNDSELFVSEEGELIENFPDEIVSPKEAKTINIYGRIIFIAVASSVWIIMGLSAGCAAFLMQPSELMKLIAYFLMYFFFLRIPFGITNKTIEKTYEVKVMPEKLLFVTLIISSYLIGINYHENIPYWLKWQFLLDF